MKNIFERNSDRMKEIFETNRMDQMIETMIKMSFGEDENDPKYRFAFQKFMEVLEPTVEDLARSLIELGGEEQEISFGRVLEQVNEEISS